MIERGIVIGGRVLPGTDRVLRDSDAWWIAGRETRPRAGATIDLIVGHWTAGPPREGPAAGRSLYRAMESRRSADGSRDLSVSVHFGIAWDGGIWQYLDLAHGAVHVGHRPTIRRSIGVETMSPGTARMAARLGVEGRVISRRVDGHRIECLEPSDALLEAWRWLADVLSRADDDRLDIPRQCAPSDRRLSVSELARARGAIEHMSLPGSTKIDSCGLLLDALGWPLAK